MELSRMNRLNYVVGDATRPVGLGPKIIAHVCNDLGAWGAGFVRAVSRRWQSPESYYRAWFKGDLQGMTAPAPGLVQLVPVDGGMWIANMIAQRGLRGPSNPVPLCYASLGMALRRTADHARDHGATVHCPRMGAGLAGGKWSDIERLLDINVVRRGVDVFVYDLPRS
jgi:O-acetyl-ADP-ribose deacetylase (regulator of RNase III)